MQVECLERTWGDEGSDEIAAIDHDLEEPADGLAGAERVANLDDMAGEPIEFLVDVELGRDQRDRDAD